MFVPEKVTSWIAEISKSKAYYEKQLFEDETQFYEYLSEINLDSSLDEDYEYINKNRDLIFNRIFELMLKKRDQFLVAVDKEMSLRNVLRIRIGFIFYFLFTNTLIFGFKESALFNIAVYSLAEWIYVMLLDLLLYRWIYKSFKKKIFKYSYEVCDEDSQEYYQSYGKSVFGSNFLSEFDDSDRGYKIQIFKDKASDDINSICVIQPIIELEDKITIKIGFMGTSTDKKLKTNILNKMVEKVCLEQEKLKQDHPGLQVTIEITTRSIDAEFHNFLINFKEFKFAKYETNEFKLFRGFNKVTFTRE